MQRVALSALVQDMLDSVAAANSVGLAAPQIGVDMQPVIFGSDASNPRRPKEEGWEGCRLAVDAYGGCGRIRMGCRAVARRSTAEADVGAVAGNVLAQSGDPRDSR